MQLSWTSAGLVRALCTLTNLMVYIVFLSGNCAMHLFGSTSRAPMALSKALRSGIQRRAESVPGCTGGAAERSVPPLPGWSW